jgi:hypothetical protein
MWVVDTVDTRRISIQPLIQEGEICLLTYYCYGVGDGHAVDFTLGTSSIAEEGVK